MLGRVNVNVMLVYRSILAVNLHGAYSSAPMRGTNVQNTF